jgi:type II secretory pathway pseudopilin PulG
VKRNALAIVLVAIIALALASWLVNNHSSSLQTQNSELQAQNSELENQIRILQNQTIRLQNQYEQLQRNLGNSSSSVKIIAFEWLGGGYVLGGVTWFTPVSVTIRNYAPFSVGGLTLSARLVRESDGAELGSGDPYINTNIDFGALNTRKIDGGILSSVGVGVEPGVVAVVTIMSGNTVLDEWRSNIS